MLVGRRIAPLKPYRGTRSFNVKRVLFLIPILVIAGAMLASAQVEVDDYPSINISDQLASDSGGTINQSDIDGYESDINSRIRSQVDTVVEDANGQLSGLGNLDPLANAFADAGVYGSNVATLRSYTDYRSFYLAAGTNVGVQFPKVDLTGGGDTDPVALLGEELTSGNAGVGLAWQTWALALGLNLDFLADGLYVSAKYGSTDVQGLETETGTVDMQSSSMGAFLNYRIIDGFWPRSPIRFRGVSIGAGAIRHSSSVGLDIPLDDFVDDGFSKDLPKGGQSDGGILPDEIDAALSTKGTDAYDENYVNADSLGTVYLEPTARLDISNQAFTVPIEIATALRLLWFFDFSLGAGVDLTFGGNSEVALGGQGDAAISGYIDGQSEYLSTNGGSLVLAKTGDGKPAFINPRITFGTAINLGPLKIDFPFAWYIPVGGAAEFKGNGLSAGMNIGLLW
jgi:hypothetical protein